MVDVTEALDRAVKFAEDQGLATYDPYDFKGSPLVMSLHQKGVFGKFAIKTIYAAAFVAPIQTRKILGVKKAISAGGLAHFASANCDLQAPEKALPLLKMLEQMAETSIGWGLPFPWQSGVATVPANQPIGHTTMSVGNAFFDFHTKTGDDWSLSMATKACNFLSSALPKTSTPTGGVALAYTPLDNSQCVNSNADAAALLAKVGAKTGQESFLELAKQISKFVVEAQNEDGSWNYLAGTKSGPGSIIDHYHTAMTISAMWPLSFILFDDKAKGAAEKGLTFYLTHLFRTDGGPKFATDRFDPIDVYGCAQGLLTLVEAAENPILPEPLQQHARERAHALAKFILDRMQDPDGSFLYRRYAVGLMRLKSLRWAQALTIRALARYHRLSA